MLKDLMVDRSALDRVIQAGGYVSVRAGSAPDGNSLPVSAEAAERALDAAPCIGCGACVAACPNGSGALLAAPAGSGSAAFTPLPPGASSRDFTGSASPRPAGAPAPPTRTSTSSKTGG